MLDRSIFLAGAASLLWVTPALAQSGNPVSSSEADAAPDRSGIQDIIVTAERRETSLQKTPMAVVAVTGEQLQRSGVSEAQDLNKLVPGLKIGQTGTMTQFFINGVGSGVANAYGDPTIAFNVDGIYMARPAAVNGVFYDLSRVEVLKGPQGTLYGRNAAAGAVNVISNRPVFRNEFAEQLELGNYSTIKVNAMANLALSDTVAVRVAGLISRRDGYLSDGYNDANDAAIRGQLLFKPTGRLTILLAGDYFAQGGKGNAAIPVPFADPSNPWAGPSTPAVTAILSAATPTLPVASRIRFYATDGFVKNRNMGARLETAWTGDSFALTAVLAHRFSIQNANSIVGAFEQFQDLRAVQNSVELRASSNGAGRLKWLLGAYYFDENVNAFSSTNRYFQGVSTLDLRPITDVSKAVFTQETLEIIDGLRVTGGIRYTREKKSQSGTNVTVTGAVIPAQGTLEFSATNYKAGIELDLGLKSMAYATYSTGFKAGGFYQGLAPNTFRPEKLISYVAGVKNRFFDNRLQLNLEAFYWDYRDKQFGTFAVINPAPATALITVNIPQVTFKGVTVDFVAVPWSGAQFSGNAQYLDAVNKVFTYPSLVPVSSCPSSAAPGGGFLVNCSGKPLSQAPKFSASVAFTQAVDLNNGANLQIGVNTHFESRALASQTMTYVNALYQDAWSMTDATLTYTSANRAVTVQAFVNNVFDKAVKTNGASQPTLPTVYFANIMPPRLFGIRLGFKH